MKAFRISGRFRMGGAWQPFSKELAAADEAAAREKLLSIFGSQHGVPRKYITITQATEVPQDQVEDHVLRYAQNALQCVRLKRNSAGGSPSSINTGRTSRRWPSSRKSFASRSRST